MNVTYNNVMTTIQITAYENFLHSFLSSSHAHDMLELKSPPADGLEKARSRKQGTLSDEAYPNTNYLSGIISF